LIEVQETTLSHQIQWAFGTKLKELIITGSNLIKILPDAFLGIILSFFQFLVSFKKYILSAIFRIFFSQL
jgi:hypothetical protein